METLTLLDGSLQGQGTVDITVFGTDAENLPRVRQVGDIVRLHRVKVRCDRREARGEATPLAPASWLGTAGHAKRWRHPRLRVLTPSRAPLCGLLGGPLRRPASVQRQGVQEARVCALLRSRGAAPFCLDAKSKHLLTRASLSQGASDAPYQHSGATFTFDDADKARLAQLRLLSRRLRQQPVLDERDLGGEYARTLCDLRHDTGFCDLVCYVLHVSWPAHQGWSSLPVIWVWDGTDAFPYDFAFRRTPEQSWPEGLAPERHAFPLAAAINHLPAVTPGNEHPWPRDSRNALKGVPPIGTIMPVVLHPHAASVFTKESMPLPGQWYKIRNIGLMIADGQMQGLFSMDSKVVPATTPPQATSCSAWLRATTDALINPWFAGERNREQRSLTRVTHPKAAHVRFSTLREVRACPAPGKFKCLVRLKAVRPAEAHRFSMPKERFISEQTTAASIDGGPGAHRPAAHDGETVLALALLVEDATDELPLILTGDDAAAFFGADDPAAAPPVLMDGPQHPAAVALQAKVDRMMQLQDTGQGDMRFPWLIVVLETYVDCMNAGPADDAMLLDMRSIKRARLCDTILKI